MTNLSCFCQNLNSTAKNRGVSVVFWLCYEFYNFYSAKTSRHDSFSGHWAAILDFVYVLVLCTCGQDCRTSEEFDAVSLAKKTIISKG